MPPDDDDSDPEDPTPLDDDSDEDIIGDVTTLPDEIKCDLGDGPIPTPVTVTDSTNAFLRDMAKGQEMQKPVPRCPECGGEMRVCANCASGKCCTGEP